MTYNSVGSGQGKSDLQTKSVDFAGTDSLPTAADLASYQGGALLNFPTVAAPITVSYNLSSVKKLQLSGTTLAKIFSLKIKKWNDSAIAADNPGVTLPSTAITVAHRADGSGTTDQLHEVPHRRSTRPTGRSGAATRSTGLRFPARRRAARRTRASRRS